MSTKIVCDLCSRETHKGSKAIRVEIPGQMFTFYYLKITGGKGGSDYEPDLCLDCVKKIVMEGKE